MSYYTTKKIKNRTKILVVSAVIFLLLAILAFFFFTRDSLKLSATDGETITLEYGIDSIPPVTALYWESFFDKEGMNVPVTTEGTIDETALGTYTLTYLASYKNKTATAKQTIVIQDTTAPVITLTGGEIGYYSPGYSYTENGFTAIDNYDGDITDQVITKQTKDSITYTVTDSHGNESSVTRTLECKDVVAPVIVLNGAERVELSYGDSYTDLGASAIDDIDGDLTDSIQVSGNVDTTVYGASYITYTVTDSNGNTAKKQRMVVIMESTPPELTLSGDSRIFLKVGETYQEAGYTAIDNADGDITKNVTITGSVDTSKVGAYYLTYTSTDTSNNVSTETRSVFVYEPAEGFDVKPNGKVVYLSFDDGPGPYTEQLLDVLDKYNVKVTFFVTNQFPDYQDMIGEAYRRGHTIAMHTYTHNFGKIYASESAYYEDLHSIQEICKEQTGVNPTIVRFPGGTSNTTSKKFCAGIMTTLSKSLPENGYQYCDWNVDSMDASTAKTSEDVFTNVTSGIANFKNSFVLQHDIKEFSVNAVEQIIQWGLENGYTFMPMNEDTPMAHHPVLN